MNESLRTPMIDLDGVGRRLESVRMALTDLGKREFAMSCGIDPSSYSKIIKGEKPLKVDMGFAVSEIWGVSLDYLYKGSFESVPPSQSAALIKALNSLSR